MRPICVPNNPSSVVYSSIRSVSIQSICAHRLALGKVWYGLERENLTAQIKARYRAQARKMFALCEKHNVTEHGESWPIAGAAAEVRKALQIEKDEPF